jgi:methionine-gamma-lyase
MLFLKTSHQDLVSKPHLLTSTKLDVVEAAITPDTKVLYCETVSNPLLRSS